MTFTKQSILIASLILSSPVYSDYSGYYRCTLNISAINQTIKDQYVSVIQKSDGSAVFAPVDIGASPLFFVGYGSGTVKNGAFSGKTSAGEDFNFNAAVSLGAPAIIDANGKDITDYSIKPKEFIYGSIGFKLKGNPLQASVDCEKIY